MKILPKVLLNPNTEKWFSTLLFYVPLFISIVFVVTVPFYPTVDGASHLYNSYILKELIFNSSSPFHTYFELNSVLVPNWLDHILLAGLLTVFSPILTQKIFLVAIILTQAILFRKLVFKLNPENKILSVLVLPFIFGSFFHGGLFNQTLSLIFLYFFIFWLINIERTKDFNFSFLLRLFGFSILFWLSSIITWAVFVSISGLFLLFKGYQNQYNLREYISKIAYITLAIIPTLMLSLFFVSKVQMATDEQPITLFNKLKLFVKLEPLVVFDTSGETRLLIPIAIIILVLGVFNYKRIAHLNSPGLQALKLFPIIALALFFVIPNQAGAGLLSYRLAMIFYLLVIILVAAVEMPKALRLTASIIIVGCFLGLQFKKQNGRIRSYSKISNDFLEAGKKMPSGATLWPVQLDSNWFIGHSNNAAGLPNSVINFENYETYYPLFPLKFKQAFQSQNNQFNELRRTKSLNQFTDINTDYVLLSGLGQNTEAAAIVEFCNQSGSVIYESQGSDYKMRLYKINR